MTRKMIQAVAAGMAVLFLAGVALSAGGGKNAVNYPAGYRSWTHVKSMVIEKGNPLYDSFGGIHHIYANSRALEALKNNAAFPNGSVLVFDLIEPKTENNAIVEGNRKILAVMQKNARRFTETGGWGFAVFKGDSKDQVVTDPKTACFACHEAQKEKDYVFSTYRK